MSITNAFVLCHSLPESSEGGAASWLISALICGSNGLVSNPGREHCVMFLSKTLLIYHCESREPGVQMGTSEFNAGGNPRLD